MYKVKYFINPEDLVNIRKELGWKEISLKQATKAINNSMINVSVYEGDKCAGIGRIVGDNVYKGMLTDVMTRKEYQGKGVGKLIVTSLINEIPNMLEAGELFQLEASPTSGNREFYIKCGLKYKPENQDGVYLWLKKD